MNFFKKIALMVLLYYPVAMFGTRNSSNDYNVRNNGSVNHVANINNFFNNFTPEQNNNNNNNNNNPEVTLDSEIYSNFFVYLLTNQGLDFRRTTPLICAVNNKKSDWVSFLLQKRTINPLEPLKISFYARGNGQKFTITINDTESKNAISYAINTLLSYRKKMIKALANDNSKKLHGIFFLADMRLNAPIFENGDTALLIAARENKQNMIQYMIDRDIDPTLKNYNDEMASDYINDNIIHTIHRTKSNELFYVFDTLNPHAIEALCNNQLNNEDTSPASPN